MAAQQILDMTPEQIALWVEFEDHRARFLKAGLKLEAMDNPLEIVLFAQELMAMMDRWGIYIQGDHNFQISLGLREPGQHYALESDGDFRCDDGQGTKQYLFGGDYMLHAWNPKPATAHTKMEQAQHRATMVRAFLEKKADV